MVSAKPSPSPSVWIIALCIAMVLCSLAAHLAADVAGAPPELAGRLAQGRAGSGEHPTMSDLLEEIALLAIAVVIHLPLLAFLNNRFVLTLRDWILPPPVRPPTVLG